MSGAQPTDSELPFARMNESDVRAEVLDPLLRRLGYAKTGNALIRREHRLEYPHLYLGRKKPGKDLTLRGVADYTLEVCEHARWTLEAKPPSEQLDEEVVQQAWSYAIHPEVQSTYFAICNGQTFELYGTASAWNAPPLLRLTHEELTSRFDEVRAFLGPAEIAMRHPNHLIEVGKPLAPGLRAFARVASGTISYHQSSWPAPLLSQMQVSIVDGTIRRDDAGRIQALLQTRAPFRDMQTEIEELGLSIHTYNTADQYLSVSADQPTTFLYQADEMFPLALDPTTFKPQRLSEPMRVEIQARATGHLDKDIFSGRFVNEMTFHGPRGPVKVIGEGSFELRVT